MLLLFPLLFLFPPVPQGGRVDVDVFVDGQTVLTGITRNNGYEDGDEMWFKAQDIELGFGEHVTSTIVEQVKQKVLVGSIKYGIHTGGYATTDSLKLIEHAGKGGAGTWTISSEGHFRDLFWSRTLPRSMAEALKHLRDPPGVAPLVTPDDLPSQITLQIMLDGVAILEGAITLDAGNDADDIWAKIYSTPLALKDDLTDTQRLSVHCNDGELTIEPVERIGMIDAERGGRYEFRQLTLTRSNSQDNKIRWIAKRGDDHPSRFLDRWISRAEMARLKNPQQRLDPLFDYARSPVPLSVKDFSPYSYEDRDPEDRPAWTQRGVLLIFFAHAPSCWELPLS